MPPCGSVPLGPSFVEFGWLVWCGLDLGYALPAVFCPWSYVSLPRAWPLVGGVFVVLVLLPARLRVSLRAVVRLSVVVGSLCVCPLFGYCRLPSCRLLLPFPAVGALWRPGPVSTLVPPSGYLVTFCDGLVALPYCWGVVVLCHPHFILSHGSKGLCSCVGFVLLSTP